MGKCLREKVKALSLSHNVITQIGFEIRLLKSLERLCTVYRGHSGVGCRMKAVIRVLFREEFQEQVLYRPQVRLKGIEKMSEIPGLDDNAVYDGVKEGGIGQLVSVCLWPLKICRIDKPQLFQVRKDACMQ